MDAYLELMLSLARDGGKIALEFIDHSGSSLKPDDSVITEADRRVSFLAHERLAPLLATSAHILVDEEDPEKTRFLDQGVLNKAPFLWSIDPIDGTRAYANRMPHYGISIGLIKDLKPFMGVVYFPSLAELFYCDGKDAFFVKDPFTAREVSTKILPLDEEITSRSVFISTDEMLSRFNWVQKQCHTMIFAAAVCEFCWPVIGRGCGSLSRVHLWDMAGAWPIFEKAGLKMRSFSTGAPLERIDVSLFEKEGSPWRFKEYYILSSARNYPILRSLLTVRYPDEQTDGGSSHKIRKACS